MFSTDDMASAFAVMEGVVAHLKEQNVHPHIAIISTTVLARMLNSTDDEYNIPEIELQAVSDVMLEHAMKIKQQMEENNEF